METNERTAAPGRPIVIKRTFGAPPARLRKAWTGPEYYRQWWGAKDFTCPYCSTDLRAGGKYLNCMRAADGSEIWGTGVYREIDAQRKLVFTDQFADSRGNVVPASEYGMPGSWPDEMQITVTFRENNANTEMEIIHEGIPTEAYEDCIAGWQESPDKLEQSHPLTPGRSD